jgi:hypothetical protein
MSYGRLRHKTVILPVVFHGWETWSLSVREEHRFRVFGNRVLKRTLGRKREKITAGTRKLHNKEPHN